MNGPDGIKMSTPEGRFTVRLKFPTDREKSFRGTLSKEKNFAEIKSFTPRSGNREKEMKFRLTSAIGKKGPVAPGGGGGAERAASGKGVPSSAAVSNLAED